MAGFDKRDNSSSLKYRHKTMAVDGGSIRGGIKYLTTGLIDAEERDSMLDEDENKSKKSVSIYSANKSKVNGSIRARQRRPSGTSTTSISKREKRGLVKKEVLP